MLEHKNGVIEITPQAAAVSAKRYPEWFIE